MKKLWVEDIAIPALFYQENSPGADYIDKSNDVISWDNYGACVIPFLFYRIKIQNILIAITGTDFSGWNNLSQVEKQIMAKYILAPKSLRLTVQTEDLDKVFWNIVVNKTRADRNSVFELMRCYISEYMRNELMSKATLVQFFKDTEDFVTWFIYSDAPDLRQWFTNETGSPYEYDGFAQKSYYSQSLKEDLMKIYNNE